MPKTTDCCIISLFYLWYLLSQSLIAWASSVLGFGDTPCPWTHVYTHTHMHTHTHAHTHTHTESTTECYAVHLSSLTISQRDIKNVRHNPLINCKKHQQTLRTVTHPPPHPRQPDKPNCVSTVCWGKGKIWPKMLANIFFLTWWSSLYCVAVEVVSLLIAT